MARYNDTDNTIKAIKSRFGAYNEIPCSSDDRRVQEIIGIVIRTIKAQSTADVAPKREVARLQAEVDRLLELVGTIPPDRVEFVSRTEINAIKENLAREIFKEFERLMENNEVWFGQTDEIREEFAELKKKYTGEVDGNG